MPVESLDRGVKALLKHYGGELPTQLTLEADLNECPPERAQAISEALWIHGYESLLDAAKKRSTSGLPPRVIPGDCKAPEAQTVAHHPGHVHKKLPPG